MIDLFLWIVFLDRSSFVKVNIQYLIEKETGNLVLSMKMVAFELEEGPPDCPFDYLKIEMRHKGIYRV